MAATVIIPARFASTRFPAKIIAAETGKPLVQHVVDQVRKCRRIREVIVAIDDGRIAEALRPFKTKWVMTSPNHQSGTDRVAEVARGLSDQIIVNVQGDEPEIEPGIVDELIERLESSGDEMATAATPFPAGADPANPNLVKVAMTLDGRAMYFSRSLIPHQRDVTGGVHPTYYLHLGIYAYRRDFLLQYTGWPPMPCELCEKLEQLRALEHGAAIHVVKVERASHGIDTPEQYAEFVRRFGGKERRPGLAEQAPV
ncbi:MAG TPA: 3-deoxy-manno-octulosonate cytidylyltransferase [Tepidisphaeraceae bacterium]|nr:3-deoxy-manno-octulosonate cytidylyltransferase [Tepidisphaeraceae bacterium]